MQGPPHRRSKMRQSGIENEVEVEAGGFYDARSRAEGARDPRIRKIVLIQARSEEVIPKTKCQGKAVLIRQAAPAWTNLTSLEVVETISILDISWILELGTIHESISCAGVLAVALIVV